jgi:glycosyltransferase involved in cell wall biosynthesis
MKIAWVTPFSRRSAIGRVSASVTAALVRRGHQIAIVRSESARGDNMQTHQTVLPIYWWQDIYTQNIDYLYDLIVLNVGDNYNYHAGIMAFIDRGICLGIFHDFYIYNLFQQWILQNDFSQDTYDQEVLLTYGNSSLSLARAAWRNEAPLQDVADSLPMTEWIASRCGAALAHSRFYLARIEAACPGPVDVAPLPFDSRDVPLLFHRNRNEVVLLTVGVMNPNKCVAEVIKAICTTPLLRERCRYRLAGIVSEAEQARLASIASEGGFNKLDFLGEIDDATLTKELANSDAVICLRRPVLEGASASAIEAMKSGRPVVVTNAGFYRDLPDELVFKVSPSVEEVEVAELLERLVQDESLRVDSGRKAQAWACDTFATERYAAALEALAKDFIRAKPVLSLARRVGHELTTLGVRAEDPGVANFSEKMRNLFGTR